MLIKHIISSLQDKNCINTYNCVTKKIIDIKYTNYDI